MFVCQGQFQIRAEHHAVITVHQTDQGTETKDCKCKSVETQTNTWDANASVSCAIQRIDPEFYPTFYEHALAQQQETLEVTEILDKVVEDFDNSPTSITEHLDCSFEILTLQLRMEFNGYMQFALANCAQSVIPVQEPTLQAAESIQIYHRYVKRLLNKY